MITPLKPPLVSRDMAGGEMVTQETENHIDGFGHGFLPLGRIQEEHISPL
jgi:hypothetical protein